MDTQSPTIDQASEQISFLELVKHITILGGTDWDKLEVEKQQEIAEKMQVVIADHLKGFVNDFGSEEVKKYYAKGLKEGITPEYIEANEELTNLLDLGMRSLLMKYMERTEVTEILNSLI